MENERDNSEALWVDACLAKLNPSAEWQPDSERALRTILNRKQPELKSRWIRISSTAAVVVGLLAVLSILPWHFIWNAATGKQGPTVEPPKTAAPAQIPPQTQVPFTVEQRAVPVREKEEKTLPPLMASPATTSSQIPPLPVIVQQSEASQGQNEKPAERVGTGATPPSVISKVEPAYTDEARRERIQGTVTLQVTIGADSTVKNVTVFKGLGYGLDENARDAMEQWKFNPGTMNGVAVSTTVRVDMNFSLK